MKIAVIAANGRSGKAFVRAALAAGHTVRAGVKRKMSLQTNPRLTTLECDATNEKQLHELLKGQDAVASFIGHIKGSDPNVQTVAIKKTIKVMKELGIKRVVSLTGTGVRFPEDKITLTDRILNLSISLIDPKRVKDGKNHVEALKASNLDWTVIRVLKLRNSPAKPFELKANGPTKRYVGRQEVAKAVLQVLEKKAFINQAPIISNP